MGMYWICLLLIGRPWMSRMMATLKSRVKVWEAAHCSRFHLLVANYITSFLRKVDIYTQIFLFSWLVMSKTVLCTLWKCSACSALTWCCFHIFKCSSVVLMKGQGLLPWLILQTLCFPFNNNTTYFESAASFCVENAAKSAEPAENRPYALEKPEMQQGNTTAVQVRVLSVSDTNRCSS